MDTMPISKFKATCLAALERVRKTGRPLRVTRFGKAIADISPPQIDRDGPSWLGSCAGTATIVGDLIEPVPADWDALR
jgi:antitoxin (DNA-binding transcriptional repressor) of toxin-antitoxin stability system